MATTSDPRAAGFDGAEFRDAIKFAMGMALPDEESERVTFRWLVDRTYSTADPVGAPYSYDEVPSSTVAKDDVQITCGVSFISRATAAQGNAVAGFESPRVIVTVLDEDYDSVAEADEIIFDGSTYQINYWEPPQGLFDVSIYKVHGTARDES
jgi:hypothetical protein